jgi:general secretion pathway protein G
MVSLKNKQSGFTIVELLIVIVIIGILAGLVITTFVGIQQRARNSERQTDINSVSSQLEGYFAKSSGYPTLTDLNTAAWRTGNEIKVGDAEKAFADPSNSTLNTLVAAVTAGRYSYVPTPTGCESPTDNAGASSGTATPCTGYTLTAVQEGSGGNYVKNSAN